MSLAFKSERVVLTDSLCAVGRISRTQQRQRSAGPRAVLNHVNLNCYGPAPCRATCYDTWNMCTSNRGFKLKLLAQVHSTEPNETNAAAELTVNEKRPNFWP